MSDELQIVLKDVKEKFDIIIEGIHVIIGKLDPHIAESRNKFEKFEKELLKFRQDPEDHRKNTGQRGVRVKKEVS